MSMIKCMIKDSCSRERTAFDKCVLPFTANKKYYFSVLMNMTDGSFVRRGLGHGKKISASLFLVLVLLLKVFPGSSHYFCS